ncbi:MAG: FUN14 domain-containing protein [Tepidisphaeraceae bacterium]
MSSAAVSSESTAPSATARSATARLNEHVNRLSGLQVKLLAGFLVLGLVGLAGVVWSWAHPSSTTTTVTTTTVHAPEGARGFAGDAPAESETTTTTDQSWTGWFSGHGARLGFGFVGGFLIGFVFRAFLKIMTLITLLVVGGLAALSYFHVLNIDFSAAHRAWASNADWITTEAGKLKDLLIAHLPSTTSGTAGVFFGLRRK